MTELFNFETIYSDEVPRAQSVFRTSLQLGSSKCLRLEWNRQFHYHVERSPPLQPVLSVRQSTRLYVIYYLLLNQSPKFVYKIYKLESNLGSRTPQIMKNSVYEHIFRTQIVSDDVLCLELRTRKPSTSWSDKLGVATF
jgi:hypothetical protein